MTNFEITPNHKAFATRKNRSDTWSPPRQMASPSVAAFAAFALKTTGCQMMFWDKWNETTVITLTDDGWVVGDVF